MPVVFRHGSLRFFFYSDEGTPREPPHIHIRQTGREAKLWLRPGPPQAYNYGFSARDLREIRELIEANREQIGTAWNELFD
jgi:uncharacterized protein DUF4160